MNPKETSSASSSVFDLNVFLEHFLGSVHIDYGCSIYKKGRKRIQILTRGDFFLVESQALPRSHHYETS